jgi:branched-subunit amino acid aminotransferase/4-amino-4-deoxychorismate lyase
LSISSVVTRVRHTLDTALRWTGRALEEVAGAPAAALLVADSWLVDAGYERAAAAHWARFAVACRELGVPRDELAAFRSAVSAVLPAEGRWFPRVELTGDGLALRLRRAPPPQRDARVLVGAPGDPRRQPRRKGPDLLLLGGLRERARAAGAEELLLCDAHGRLLEGALSSLLWWEDGVLWTTPDESALPGVTRALLLDIAAERGVPVRRRAPDPAELVGREAWLTSALHGLRAVSGWVAPRQAAGAPVHAREWRDALDRHG